MIVGRMTHPFPHLAQRAMGDERRKHDQPDGAGCQGRTEQSPPPIASPGQDDEQRQEQVGLRLREHPDGQRGPPCGRRPFRQTDHCQQHEQSMHSPRLPVVGRLKDHCRVEDICHDRDQPHAVAPAPPHQPKHHGGDQPVADQGRHPQHKAQIGLMGVIDLWRRKVGGKEATEDLADDAEGGKNRRKTSPMARKG